MHFLKYGDLIRNLLYVSIESEADYAQRDAELRKREQLYV